MKLYIGCSLTHAPEDFREAVEALKNKLRGTYEVLDFVGTTKGTPEDVYAWDIHTCVSTCDVFIALCDFPSTGLGYELGVAIEKLEKPTLALAQKETKVARLLLGIAQPNFQFMRYESLEEVPVLIEKFLQQIT